MDFYSLIYYIILFSLGLLIGSFLNVCIYRIPKNIKFANDRSKCPICDTQIKWYDNIPIVSYILLGAKCRSCKTRISPRYPGIELLTAILFLICGLKIGISQTIWIFLILTASLIVLTFIDFDTQEIPDRFHVIIFVLAVINILLYNSITIKDALIGMFIVSLPMFLIAVFTGGLGMGDVKLMAAAGLFLGFKSTLLATLIGCVLGSIVAVSLIALKKKGRRDAIAFGPYLAIGIYIASLYGNEIISAYLSLLS